MKKNILILVFLFTAKLSFASFINIPDSTLIRQTPLIVIGHISTVIRDTVIKYPNSYFKENDQHIYPYDIGFLKIQKVLHSQDSFNFKTGDSIKLIWPTKSSQRKYVYISTEVSHTNGQFGIWFLHYKDNYFHTDHPGRLKDISFLTRINEILDTNFSFEMSTCNVLLDTLTINGRLIKKLSPNDGAAENRINKALVSLLKTAYQRHLKEDIKLAGKIKYNLTVNRFGLVDKVEIDATNFQSQNFIHELTNIVNDFYYGLITHNTESKVVRISLIFSK